MRYCQGLFANGHVPADVQATFVSSTAFYQQITPLDARLRVIHDLAPASASRFRRYLWHLLLYPHLVHQISPDVEFYPSGQLRVSLRQARTVATCHNLLLFDPKEMARFTDGREHHNFEIYRDRQARSMHAATGVIFLSEHSRRVVLEAQPGIKRHTVVAHGLEPEFRLSTPRAYAFGSPVWLLYVSTVHYYKHHCSVVRAVKAVRRATGLDLRLRLVGGGSSLALAQLRETLHAEDATCYVEMAGEVNRAALLREYRQADLFIFASSSETFGITLLEAMGARLPIACSIRTGLPDILRDAGVYFDPEDSPSIVSALCDLLTSPERRHELGEKAYKYSLDYTWERCAWETFEFIRQVNALK